MTLRVPDPSAAAGERDLVILQRRDLESINDQLLHARMTENWPLVVDVMNLISLHLGPSKTPPPAPRADGEEG